MSPLPHRTELDLLVLHTLRCIGSNTLPRIAATAGLEEDDAQSELIDLAAAGLVSYTPGAFGGWGITAVGRETDAVRIAAELATAGARASVERALAAFLQLNAGVLEVCSSWQLRSVGGQNRPNDHTDHAYDDRLLARLSSLDRRGQALCSELAAVLGRFERYPVRLTEALGRAWAGDQAAVADGLESYHNVWFQLHEDLLVTSGLPRW
ncbi:MAG: hypothetical protein WAS07_09275 [Micropruina sp.]